MTTEQTDRRAAIEALESMELRLGVEYQRKEAEYIIDYLEDRGFTIVRKETQP